MIRNMFFESELCDAYVSNVSMWYISLKYFKEHSNKVKTIKQFHTFFKLVKFALIFICCSEVMGLISL